MNSFKPPKLLQMQSSHLTNFLSNVRSTVLGPSTAATKSSTLVLGNPSADLDSFVSALILSYCYSRRQNAKNRLFLPLINLSGVPSSDLWRLRPEFGTALRLAHEYKSSGEQDQGQQDQERFLLSQLITIRDLQHNDNTSSWFPSESSDGSPQQPFEDVILVDHNAPAIPAVSSSVLSNLKVTACIDHHEDESKVPSSANPRIVKTGIGSCTSLVVKYLRDQNLWPYPKDDSSNEADAAQEAKELSILALAPILIDTANLTAPGKVSDTDRQIVSYLEDVIEKSQSQSPSHFDISDFYTQISTSKSAALDRLTVTEIFDRDYKEWTEQSSTSRPPSSLKIGISSVNKSLTYLLLRSLDQHDKVPRNESDLNTSLGSFSLACSSLRTDAAHFAQSKNLDIHVIITAFTTDKAFPPSSSDSDPSFHRELIIPNISSPSEPASKTQQKPFVEPTISTFISKHSSALDLKRWTAPPSTWREESAEEDHDPSAALGHVFVQGALGKSRKQVGPAIRGVAREVLDREEKGE